MKTLKVMVICLAGIFALNCGSGSGSLSGPDLSVSELSSIIVDQIKFSGGLEDDSDGVPEVAFYLRCADSNVDIACAGQAAGLSLVKKEGVIYGRVDARFNKIEDTSVKSCFDVKLVFVEKDSSDCPAPIADDDDVIWISQVLIMDADGSGTLLNSAISDSEGTVMAYLTTSSDEQLEELDVDLPVQEESTLILDQLFFDNPKISGKSSSFRLIARNSSSDDNFRCEASFNSSDSGIMSEGIIYGNLNIPLLDEAGEPCAITDENKLVMVDIYLYISGENSPLMTSESTTVVDLVDNDGGREDFGNNGYLRFISIDNIL